MAGDQCKRRDQFPSCEHTMTTKEGVNIKKGITSFDTSRFDCPAMLPRGPGTPPLSRACHYNSQWPYGQAQPTNIPLPSRFTTQKHFNHSIPATTYNTQWTDFQDFNK